MSAYTTSGAAHLSADAWLHKLLHSSPKSPRCSLKLNSHALWLQRVGNSAGEEPPYRAASSGDESEDNDSVLDDWQPQVSPLEAAVRAL